jgi:hypothetical protein
MNPRAFKAEGFKHLDRVVDLVNISFGYSAKFDQCAKYGIYTIIDLHSAPGGQSVFQHPLVLIDLLIQSQEH